MKTLAACFAILVMLASCATGAKKDATSGASPLGDSGAPLPPAPLTDSITKANPEPRTLVVFYSQGRNGTQVAEDLASIFSADIERIEDATPRSSGFFGFMTAGFQGTFGIAGGIKEPRFSPRDYGRVIVITPIWSWSLSPPVRAWLRRFKGVLPRSGFVTVSGDTKPDKVAAAMSAESGARPDAVLGFSDKDFLPANRTTYVGKISDFADKLR